MWDQEGCGIRGGPGIGEDMGLVRIWDWGGCGLGEDVGIGNVDWGYGIGGMRLGIREVCDYG